MARRPRSLTGRMAFISAFRNRKFAMAGHRMALLGLVIALLAFLR